MTEAVVLHSSKIDSRLFAAEWRLTILWLLPVSANTALYWPTCPLKAPCPIVQSAIVWFMNGWSCKSSKTTMKRLILSFDRAATLLRRFTLAWLPSNTSETDSRFNSLRDAHACKIRDGNRHKLLDEIPDGTAPCQPESKTRHASTVGLGWQGVRIPILHSSFYLITVLCELK